MENNNEIEKMGSDGPESEWWRGKKPKDFFIDDESRDAQKYIDRNFPIVSRKKIARLDLSSEPFKEEGPELKGNLINLEGFVNLRELEISTYAWDNFYDGPWTLGIGVLDLRCCLNLEKINCQGNSLSCLNVNNLKKLKEVNCSRNNLKELDINSLEKIEITKLLTNLVEIDCNNNYYPGSVDSCGNLTSLYLSGCVNLKSLDCSHNRLITLNLNENKKLVNVNCSFNSLINIVISDQNSGTLGKLILNDNNLAFRELTVFSWFKSLKELRIGTDRGGIVYPRHLPRNIVFEPKPGRHGMWKGEVKIKQNNYNRFGGSLEP